MDWLEAGERLASPILEPLRAALARLPRDRWPKLEDLNGLAEGLTTARGKPLRFVRAHAPGDRERRSYYELHIDETGEVETRPGNWHDLFNALAWIAYPRAKAAINAQHVAILEERGEAESRERSPERDALTLFDEGGLIVACRAPELLRLIADFHWKELFWTRRADLEGRIRFLAFGHALSEKALDPYIGMVAKTVFVPVDEFFFMLPVESQVERCDALMAAHFSQRSRFTSPRVMAPLPVLGIPGWHPRTSEEAFYDDRTHFREKTRP